MGAALDGDLIHRTISDDTRQLLERLDVLDTVDSTNTWLMEHAERGAGRLEIVLAEHQTAGRGRSDRCWLSPRGSGLCLSMGYTFAATPAQLSSLTLVIGVAVAKALDRIGARGHRLKWPNDIMAHGAKLGGILTDAVSGDRNGITVIIGIGLNINLGDPEVERAMADIDQPVTDLKRCLDEMPSRSLVAAAVIESVRRALLRFEADGLAPFRHEWNTYDGLKGKDAIVDTADSTFGGVADGIDDTGALRILTDTGRRRVFTGSVRLADAPVAQR